MSIEFSNAVIKNNWRFFLLILNGPLFRGRHQWYLQKEFRKSDKYCSISRLRHSTVVLFFPGIKVVLEVHEMLDISCIIKLVIKSLTLFFFTYLKKLQIFQWKT